MCRAHGVAYKKYSDSAKRNIADSDGKDKES